MHQYKILQHILRFFSPSDLCFHAALTEFSEITCYINGTCFIINFSVNELLKMKEDLTKERDEQLAEIVKLREQLAESQNKQQKLETDQDEATAKIQEVYCVLCLQQIIYALYVDYILFN